MGAYRGHRRIGGHFEWLCESWKIVEIFYPKEWENRNENFSLQEYQAIRLKRLLIHYP